MIHMQARVNRGSNDSRPEMIVSTIREDCGDSMVIFLSRSLAISFNFQLIITCYRHLFKRMKS